MTVGKKYSINVFKVLADDDDEALGQLPWLSTNDYRDGNL